MCKKCERDNMRHKAVALEQVKEMFSELRPETEFLLFTANVDDNDPKRHFATCQVAGALNRPALAALLAELHMRCSGDPEVYNMALEFITLRQEQKAKQQEKEPLDLSGSTIMPASNQIH